MSDSKSKFVSALLASTVMMAVSPALAQENPPVGETPEPEASEAADVVVVRGAYIPDEKRVTSEITSVLEPGDFQATGDADIAAALGRLTGISVADGKFAIVRGLNDRYSNTILNGSLVSSPEPLRRAVPLDLFPTSFVGSAVVQKTYAPEFGLDFGGGLIAVETAALPSEGFLEIGASGGVNTETTLRRGYLYNGGGDSDYTGFDDGRRDLPPSFADTFSQTKLGDAPAEVQAATAIELADWTDFVVLKGNDMSPDGGASIEAGERFDFSPDFSLGILAAAGYSSQFRNKNGVSRTARIGANTLDIRDDYQRLSTEHTLDFNALLSVGLDLFENHSVTASGLVARSTLKEARILQGFNASEGRDVRIDNTEWYEREVAMAQLQGEHIIPELMDLEIDWRGSYSEAERDAPYGRQVWYTPAINPATGEETLRYSGRREDNTTEFSNVQDRSRDIGVDAMLPVQFGAMDIELKAGYAYYDKLRDTTVRTFNYAGTLPQAFLFARIDEIISPENVQNGTLSLTESGGLLTPDNFRGLLEIDAAYVGFDAQLTDYLRVALGGRYEHSIQIADTFNVGTASGIEQGETITSFDNAVESEYFFPAATLTWNFADDLQLRLAYSQTIARPQFRETAFSRFRNTENDSVFRGNPYLTNSEFENYDARLEYYFGRDQFVTLGAFYKTVDKPIEEFNISLGETFASSFLNAPSAELYGAEFEFEKILPLNEWAESWFGWDNDWMSSKDWIFKTNYTYTDSSVSADGQVSIATPSGGSPQETVVDASAYIVDGRQLQGLSEHLFNIQIGYEDVDANSTATLVLNFTDDRIRATENLAAQLPAIVETPPVMLDFVYTRDLMVFGGDYSFGLKIQNILDESYEASQTQGDVSLVVDGYDLGRTFSVSVGRRF